MKRFLICLGVCISLLIQSTFAANLYKEIPYTNTSKFGQTGTNEVSDGVLYNGERVRLDWGRNHYMKCKLAINQIKPNSRNLITVVVNNQQIVSYTDFTQQEQDFYIWTDVSFSGDPHITFYSWDLTTNKPNNDVFIYLSDIAVYPGQPQAEFVAQYSVIDYYGGRN